MRSGIDAISEKEQHTVIIAGLVICLLMLGQSLMRYVWRLYLIGTSHEVAKDIRLQLYDQLQKLPLKYYQKIRTGDLMSRATNDIASVREAMGPGILVAADAAIVFLMILPAMLWLSPKLTLMALAFYPLVPWFTVKVGDKIDALFEQLQKRMSHLSAFTQEIFGAIRLIKSMCLEQTSKKRFLAFSKKYESNGIELAKYRAIFSPTLNVVADLGTFLILIVGGMEVINGAITVGTFVAFQRFVVQLSWPMEAIGWAVTLNREGFAAHRRLQEIFAVPKVKDSLISPAFSPNESALLEICNLNFQYEKKSEFQLQMSNMVVNRGKKIGIVGPIGCGKTTLFSLCQRLYEPPLGSFYYNRQDITSIPLHTLRREITGVEQQIYLFSESILDNVRMGATTKISDSQAKAAIRTACLAEEILELERSFNSTLGEKGINLSGGQKQRLALARALVRKPQILLLDDAFSAIDVDIERQIIFNLMEQYSQLTLIFASHRLSIMPLMDEVWVLDSGRLEDKGPHSTLLTRNALYQQLWHGDFQPAAKAPTEKRMETRL